MMSTISSFKVVIALNFIVSNKTEQVNKDTQKATDHDILNAIKSNFGNLFTVVTEIECEKLINFLYITYRK
jgi:hypothetical protein